MKQLFTTAVLLFSATAFAQVGINNTSPKATLDITAKTTDGSKAEGLIIPQVAGNQIRTATTAGIYGASQKGLIVYASSADSSPAGATVNITAPGYYYFDGSVWQRIATGGSSLNTTLNSGNIYVGNASNVATSVVPTGDVTISNTGVTSIGSGKVTSSQIADGTVANADLTTAAALTVKGNATNATATPTDIVAGTDGYVLRRSGTALGFGTVATAGIADNAVTVAKLPSGASATTFLRGDGTWVTPTDTNTTYTAGTGLSLSGTTFSATDASTSAKGIVQLAGDLAGTAASPTVAKIQNKAVSSTAPSSGQVLKYNSTTSAWEPAADNDTNTTYTAGTGLSLSGTTFSATDASTSAKGIVQLAGDLAGTATSPTVAKIQNKAVSSTAPSSGQVLKYNSTTSAWEPAADNDTNTTYTAGTGLSLSGTIFSATDASTSAKGIVQLAGDLAGTATSPTVAKIQNKAVSSTAPSSGQVLKYNSTTSAWEPAADADTNYTAGTGLSLSGTTFSATDASTSAKGIVQLAGDLAGTATSPTVAKIQNKAVSSTAPSSGQVLKYNSTTSAWEPAADNDTNTTYSAGTGLSLSGTTFSATDASTSAKGIVQLAGDLAGTAASPSIATGAVTSAKIADGTIANADLNSSVGGIYKGDGSLSANTIVTQTTNTLAFTSTATTGTSHFTVDGNTLNVDAANDKVGIGTSAPSNKLHVSATADPLRLDGLQSGTKTMNYLVADTNGVIKSVTPESTNPSNVYVFVKMANDQSVTYSSNSFVNTLVPFDTKVTDTNSAYNLSTQTFTAPENGYYLINQVLSMNFDCTAASNTYVYSIVNAAGNRFQAGSYSSDTNISYEGGSAVQSVVVYLTTGQTAKFYYVVMTSGTQNAGTFKFAGENSTLCGHSNMGLSNYLTITKL